MSTATILTTPISPYTIPAGQGNHIEVFGSNHQILATGAQTGGVFTQFHNIVPPQGGPMLHVHHQEDETFYVLEGRLAFHVGKKVIEAGPGDYVFAPRGIPHRFINIGTVPARMLVTCTPSGIEEFFARSQQILDDDPANMEAIIADARRNGMELCAPE